MVSNLREALKDWSWLKDTRELEIVSTTCLGNVILRDNTAAELILDVVAGEIRRFDDAERELLSGESGFVAHMESHGLKLGPGQCYGLKPYAIFKGYAPENAYVATLAEYVSFMGSFHRQTHDLPDGTQVRFEVINHGVSQ